MLGLGSFDIGALENGRDILIVVLLFDIATMFIMIIFFNMLIAIMSDTFENVSQDREKYKRTTELKIMTDYIKLIDHRSIYRKKSFSEKFVEFRDGFLSFKRQE